MFLRGLFSIVVVICLTFLPEAAAAQTRRALIIGNALYQSLPQLQNTIDDAEAYNQTFTDLGYEVSFYNDLDLDGLANAVDSFAASITAGDSVVVVYTGHGWSDGRENFLVPTDAPDSGSETKLRGASYPLRDGQNGLLDVIDAAGASLTVAIIDACRNNPFTAKAGTRAVGFSRGLAPVSAPQGSFVIFSAGEGQEALDRLPDDAPDQKLSVFTRNLAPLLKSGAYLEDAIAEAQLETATMAATFDGHLQHPAYYDQTLGKTCLAEHCEDLDKLAGNATTPSQPQTQTPQKAVINESNPLILACDTAAQHLANPDNPNGVAPVVFSMIDGPAAETACAAANAKFPDHARSKYHLARVKSAMGDDAAALKLYQDLAADEYAPAIFALGDSYLNGSGITANPTLAATYFETACKMNHQTACASLARMLFDGTAVSADKPRSRSLATKACEVKDPYGCSELAYQQALDGDAKAALQNYATACDLGDSWGCRELGFGYLKPENGPVDTAQAMVAFENGCSKNDSASCGQLAWYQEEKGDTASALQSYDKGCKLKDGFACTNLGFLYGTAKGVSLDEKRAIELYEKGCSFGNGLGCLNAGNMRNSDTSTKDELRVALEFYAKGCALDNGDACRFAGVFAYEGTVDPESHDKGRELTEKACNLNAPRGCALWGYYLETSGFAGIDDAKIVAAYLKACDLKLGDGCGDMGRIYANGLFGQPKDPAKAREYYELGCNQEVFGYSCDRLARVLDVAKEPELFVDTALKACDAGYGDECVSLALWDYGPPRPRPAVDLLVKGLQQKSEIPKQVLSSLDSKQITLLQQALGQLGLYNGTVDGKRGKGTTAALDAVYAK